MNDLPIDPATEQYVSLATFRRNGTEVRTPVWMDVKGRSTLIRLLLSGCYTLEFAPI